MVSPPEVLLSIGVHGPCSVNLGKFALTDMYPVGYDVGSYPKRAVGI